MSPKAGLHGLALVLAALMLSGLLLWVRQCNMLGLIGRTDAQSQMEAARAQEQSGP